MSILFVEDDAFIASGVTFALKSEGYTVLHCTKVSEAKQCMESQMFSLALLDLGLPDGTGYDICTYLKKRCPATPVIFLTAVDDEANIVKGLEIGAEDYITKPFCLKELLARIKNVLRRGQSGNAGISCLHFGTLAIYPEKGRIEKNGSEIVLSQIEYKLLLLFANNKGNLLTRGQILNNLWDVEENFVNDNTLTVSIKRLREKIEDDPQTPALIQTVRGMGYKAGG